MAFATYREDSIKNAGISSRNIFQIMVPCHQIQQWRTFLSSSANKANLIWFLVVEWKTRRREIRSNYVTSEKICLHISKDPLAEVAGLQLNSEEADTRIILHAAHAAADGYRAFVVTPDGMGDSS